MFSYINGYDFLEKNENAQRDFLEKLWTWQKQSARVVIYAFRSEKNQLFLTKILPSPPCRLVLPLVFRQG